MALQPGALRNALIGACAQPEMADKAAEELNGYENRLNTIGVKLERLTGDVRVVQAMGAVTITLLMGVLWRLLSH